MVWKKLGSAALALLWLWGDVYHAHVFAQSLPSNGTVVAGQATIGVPAAGSLLIQQHSTNAIINWNGFSVGGGKSVHFNNGSGATLNRVTGTSISRIDGSLSATGSLFLINQNGMVIGESGRINTGGSFIGSTLDVPNSEFLGSGAMTFSGTSDAAIINYGKISSLGGDVSLIGLNVTNEGTIDAPNGTAGLISGREILMRDAALDEGLFVVKLGDSNSSATNKGIIKAANAELRANGGNVYALAGNRDGLIEASGVTKRDGRVFLTASEGTVTVGATVKAQRAVENQPDKKDGGDIFINAGFVSQGGLLDASGATGGNITIRGGIVSLAEPITVRGTQGNGGTIDIASTGDSLVFPTAIVDASGKVDGGSIRHITGSTLTHSGSYLAIGETGVGGTIDIGGGATRLLSSTLDASGATGGGRIRVGGEYQGGKDLLIDELANSLRLAVTDGTIINANATGENGDGGRIILWGDEKAAILATVSAKPGTQSGAGGFVEISSGGNLIYRATVETGVGERKGEVLLDPKNFTVADVTFNQSIFILGNGYTGGGNIDVSALEAFDVFGFAVSLDGNRLAVGADEEDGFGNSVGESGAVYLFSFTDAAFSGGTLEATIGKGYTGGKNIDVAALETGDRFGSAVSLDGNRLAVGAFQDDGSGNSVSQSGAVYLFTFTDAAFSAGSLEATVGKDYTTGKNIDVAALDSSDRFGFAVSLDGNRLAVGAYQDDGNGNSTSDSGAVYLFTFTDAAFSAGSLEATIGKDYTTGKNIDVSALGSSDRFSSGVSLDGNRLAVGALQDDGSGNSTSNSGSAYLFTFTDAAFSGGSLEATVGRNYTGGKNINVTALASSDFFGKSLSLDGNRLAVGASLDDGFGNSRTNSGAVYLFSFTDAAFSGGLQEAIVGKGYTGGKNIDVANLATEDRSGVAVSLDDNRLAIGAFYDDGASDSIASSGSVYLITNAFSDGKPEDVGDAVFATNAGDDITITPTALKALLDAGNNVTLQANNDGFVTDAILVNNPGGNGGALTLQVGRSLFINANITTDNGNLILIANELLANGVVDAQRDAGAAVITVANGVALNAGTGDITLELRAGTGKTNSAAGDITFAGNNTISADTFTALNEGGETNNAFVLGAGTALTTTGAGNALVVSSDIFTNNAGAGAFSVAGGSRFLVYSDNSTDSTQGGLGGGDLYNRTFAANAPASITQTGNQFIFAAQSPFEKSVAQQTSNAGRFVERNSPQVSTSGKPESLKSESSIEGCITSGGCQEEGTGAQFKNAFN